MNAQGSIAEITIQTQFATPNEAQCLYQSGEKQLGTCDFDAESLKIDALGGGNMNQNAQNWGFILGGEAHMEEDFGVTLGGVGDYLKIQDDDNSGG